MSKLTSIDTHLIKECIKTHYLAAINKELNDITSCACVGYYPDGNYSIQQKNIKESERLIGLMESLECENN